MLQRAAQLAAGAHQQALKRLHRAPHDHGRLAVAQAFAHHQPQCAALLFGQAGDGVVATPRRHRGDDLAVDALDGRRRERQDVGDVARGVDDSLPLLTPMSEVAGRMSVQVGAQLQLAKQTRLQLVAHTFRAMESADGFYTVGGGRARPGQVGDRELGHEIDLLLDHRFNRHLSAYGGYSHLFAGDGISATGPSEDQMFFYLGVSALF